MFVALEKFPILHRNSRRNPREFSLGVAAFHEILSLYGAPFLSISVRLCIYDTVLDSVCWTWR